MMTHDQKTARHDGSAAATPNDDKLRIPPSAENPSGKRVLLNWVLLMAGLAAIAAAGQFLMG